MSAEKNGTKKPWETMTVTYQGHARDVILGGGGKKTPAPSDPGEVRKPSQKESGT